MILKLEERYNKFNDYDNLKTYIYDCNAVEYFIIDVLSDISKHDWTGLPSKTLEEQKYMRQKVILLSKYPEIESIYGSDDCEFDIDDSVLTWRWDGTQVLKFVFIKITSSDNNERYFLIDKRRFVVSINALKNEMI